MNNCIVIWEHVRDGVYVKKGKQFVSYGGLIDRDYAYWWMDFVNKSENKELKPIGIWKITLKPKN